jgi:hypothetical protein
VGAVRHKGVGVAGWSRSMKERNGIALQRLGSRRRTRGVRFVVWPELAAGLGRAVGRRDEPRSGLWMIAEQRALLRSRSVPGSPLTRRSVPPTRYRAEQSDDCRLVLRLRQNPIVLISLSVVPPQLGGPAEPACRTSKCALPLLAPKRCQRLTESRKRPLKATQDRLEFLATFRGGAPPQCTCCGEGPATQGVASA